MTDIKELKQKLSLLKVVSQHVGRLKKSGGEFWARCPFHSEKTASFAVKEKEGEEVFFCQGCGAGGDIIRFVEMISKCSTKEAIAKLEEMAGVEKPNSEWLKNDKRIKEVYSDVAPKTPKTTLPLSVWSKFENDLAASPAAIEWLDKVRGIDLDTAKKLRLGFCQKSQGWIDPKNEHIRNAGWILFPRIHGDKLVAVKMRSIAAKIFSQWKDMDGSALFNVETVNPFDPVFVTEGELDTAVLEQAGFCAVSIPSASTKISSDAKKELKGADFIYLAGDNDGGVGNAAMRQLHRELGENTALLVWPQGIKDANDFFLSCNRNIEEFRKQVNKLADKAKNTPVEGFTSLLERLRSVGGTNAASDPNRLYFPLKSLDDMNYNPPGSIVTIYSTYSGTGKTIFATQLMLHEAKRGEIVVVFSPELRDEQYLALIASQVIGPKRDKGLNRAGTITQEDYEETARILDIPTERNTNFRYYIGHSLLESDPDKILDFIEQTIKITGATRFVIDTLHRITEKKSRESQTEAEGRIVKRLESLAIKYGTIFVLIGQSNKEAEDLKEQRNDSYGVLRGSRELVDVSYGIYLLHRKRKKEHNSDDILELETEVVLRKDRGKGPGKSTARLIYRPDCSKFYELSPVPDIEAAPQIEAESSIF
jgi:KaiC/GvpD/RAD55 family RecA-like ATPase